jgi:formamidopyrimidine-DNA glycosylase
MAELPEIFLIAQEMHNELVGKTIVEVEVFQPKCLNLTPEEFRTGLCGKTIQKVDYRGKWIFVDISPGWLLLNLGMGGEILLVDRNHLPEKYRLLVDFQDGTCLAINFWWFGYTHYTEQLADHKMTSGLGTNALDLDPPHLQTLLKNRRGTLKTFLLDQDKIAGIGNFYIHDILFQAHLHPNRTIQSLRESEVVILSEAIRDRLNLAIYKGGFAYEQDLYGKKGNFGMEDLIIGYKENQPCPVCGTIIKKLKTGSTSSFVCSQYQPIPS